MEILKISDDTVKISLSARDVALYSSEVCPLADADTETTMRILQDICDGENVFEGYRLSVQLFTTPVGDCEMFVRRMGSISMSLTDWRNESLTPVRGYAHLDRRVAVYIFDEMPPMLQSCHRLIIAGYRGESKAYSEQGTKKYYLVLEEKSPLPEEHGGSYCTKNITYYIAEHCFLICTDAVDVLGNMI